MGDRRTPGARSDLMERLVRVLLREPDGALSVVRADGETRATFQLAGQERPLVSIVGRTPPPAPVGAQPDLPFPAAVTTPAPVELFVLDRAAWDRLGPAGRMRLEDPLASGKGDERVSWRLGATAVHSELFDVGDARRRALVRAEESVGLRRVSDRAPWCGLCLCLDAIPCADGCTGRETGWCSRCGPDPRATTKKPKLSPPTKLPPAARSSKASPPKPAKGTVLVFRDEDYWGRGGAKGLAGLPPFSAMKGGLGSTTGGDCRPDTYVGPADPADPRLAAALAAAAKAGVPVRRIDDADLRLAREIVAAERLGSKARVAKARQHGAKGSPRRVLDAKPEGGTP